MTPILDLSTYGLDRFGPDDVISDPFPHIFVPAHAIPKAAYDHLLPRFPPVDFFLAGRDLPDNHKVHCTTARTLRGDGIDQCWRDFAAAVTRSDALDQLMRIFAPMVEKESPEITARYGTGDLTAGRRSDRTDMAIDQQVTCHSPAKGSCAAWVMRATRWWSTSTRRGASSTTPPAPPGPTRSATASSLWKRANRCSIIPMVAGHDAWWRQLVRPAREAVWRVTSGDPGFVP